MDLHANAKQKHQPHTKRHFRKDTVKGLPAPFSPGLEVGVGNGADGQPRHEAAEANRQAYGKQFSREGECVPPGGGVFSLCSETCAVPDP